MSKYFDAMEPIFFTPPNQATHPIGGRRLFKGGGGGGQAERDATPEERALWATQERIARETFNMGAPKYQQSIEALGTLAGESMDGTLATRARGIAGADAAVASGSGLAAATRSLDRYGATANPNALAATATNAGLTGAAMKSEAMNKAGMWAEDQKWNRNQGLFNSVQGLPGQTTNSLSSLSNQIGQDRAASNANYTNQMTGLGQAAAYGVSKMFKDGGAVEKGYANGGFTPIESPFKNGMPSIDDESKDGSGLGMSDVAAAAAPALLTEGGAGAMKAAGKFGMDAIRSGLSQAAAPVVNASAPVAVGSNAATVLNAGLGAAEGAAAAGTAGAAAAVPTAAAAAPSAAAAAPLLGIPGWGWALGAGLLLSQMFADGGEVRKDMTPGGAVDGPGTETSDSVPARLSDGEYVLNAETVKMVGKGALDRLNAAGLKRRYGGAGTGMMGFGIRVKDGEVRAAGGGFWGDFGLAARGFVPTAMALDQQKMLLDQRKEENTRRDRNETENTRRFELQEGRAVAAETSRLGAEKGAAERDRFTKNELGGIQEFAKQQQIISGKLKSGASAVDVAPHLTQAYNTFIRDGRHAIYDPGKGTINLHGEDGNILQTMTPDQAVAMMTSPEIGQQAKQEAYARILANGRPDVAKAIFEMDDKTATRIQTGQIASDKNALYEKLGKDRNRVTLDVAQLHEAGANSRNAATNATTLATRGALTPTQQRDNTEIDAARERIASMDPADVKRKSQKATNTGRENADYDPSISRAAALAARRKVGDDQWFDKRQQPQAATAPQPSQSRFASDPAMKGYKMGKRTSLGFEVLDASGKLLGHYD